MERCKKNDLADYVLVVVFKIP